MKIRKVDDKPMVLHTKKKARLHIRKAKTGAVKGRNVYTASRGPKAVKVSVPNTLKGNGTSGVECHKGGQRTTVLGMQWK